MGAEKTFHFEDVSGLEQRITAKVAIINSTGGKLDYIYAIWAFGGLSLVVTFAGMLPYFRQIMTAPPTKKRRYYFIISNLSCVFTLVGVLSILYGDFYLAQAIQKIYEAIALNALRKLMLGYMGGMANLLEYSKAQGEQNYWRVPPVCCFIPPCFLPNRQFDRKSARWLQLYTKQFVIIAPILAVTILFFAHIYGLIVGKTEETEEQITKVLLLCRFCIVVSTLFALYAVFVGWKFTRSLSQFNITKKFVLFKVFILLALIQEQVLEFVYDRSNFFPENELYTGSQSVTVCIGILLCIEGPLIMFFLRCTDAYNPQDLIPSKKFSMDLITMKSLSSMNEEEEEEQKQQQQQIEEEGGSECNNSNHKRYKNNNKYSRYNNHNNNSEEKEEMDEDIEHQR